MRAGPEIGPADLQGVRSCRGKGFFWGGLQKSAGELLLGKAERWEEATGLSKEGTQGDNPQIGKAS